MEATTIAPDLRLQLTNWWCKKQENPNTLQINLCKDKHKRNKTSTVQINEGET